MLNFIFRIETWEKLGPYYGYPSIYDFKDEDPRILECTAPSPQRPLVEDDLDKKSVSHWRQSRWKKDWVCGFKSLEQLQNWFDQPRIREVFHENGYVLAQYLVREPHILKGEKQVLFNRRAAKCIAYRRCDDLTAEAINVAPDDLYDVVHIDHKHRFHPEYPNRYQPKHKQALLNDIISRSNTVK